MQKKEYNLGGGAETIGEGALGPSVADGTLGLFLLPGRTAGAPLHRSGRRSYRSCDSSLVLIATRAATALLLHRGTDVQMRSTCIGHGAKCWKEETLDAMKERKMMRQRKKLMTELGFLPSPKHALFISTY
jgi:hypothetical protein